MFSIPTMIAHGVTYAYAAVLMAAAGGGFVRGSIVPERSSVFGDGSEPRALVAKNSKKTAIPPSTRCTAGLFTGTWTYQNCNAATIEFTMGCTDNEEMCSFQETIVDVAGEQEINTCPIGGLFQDETGSNVAYNASNGLCEIDYFHFTEDLCGLYQQLGMKAYINLNEEDGDGPPATMYLIFSEDGGDTFYNKDNPRVATRISNDFRRDLLEEQEEHSETSSVTTDSTKLQRRRLCGSIEGLPECTLACKGELYDEKKQNWAGRVCCAVEEQSALCILNSNSSTCNCSDNVQCYIDMRCDDKNESCKAPECSLACKKASRECCEGHVEFGKCILNSKTSVCNCSNDVRCYVDMRCDDNKTTWREDVKECRLKPYQVCKGRIGSDECTEGYRCRYAFLACGAAADPKRFKTKKRRRSCCVKSSEGG